MRAAAAASPCTARSTAAAALLRGADAEAPRRAALALVLRDAGPGAASCPPRAVLADGWTRGLTGLVRHLLLGRRLLRRSADERVLRREHARSALIDVGSPSWAAAPPRPPTALAPRTTNPRAATRSGGAVPGARGLRGGRRRRLRRVRAADAEDDEAAAIGRGGDGRRPATLRKGRASAAARASGCRRSSRRPGSAAGPRAGPRRLGGTRLVRCETLGHSRWRRAARP